MEFIQNVTKPRFYGLTWPGPKNESGHPRGGGPPSRVHPPSRVYHNILWLNQKINWISSQIWISAKFMDFY